MDLSKYNIEKLIAWSNTRMTSSEKIDVILWWIVGIKLLQWGTFFTPIKALFMLGATYSFLKPVYSYMKCVRKRLYASKRIKSIVKELEKNGIHTTKLKLQKATTFTVYRYDGEKRSLGKVHTAVFQDKYGQLKALRQIRSEILKNPYSYIACLRDSIKESKCESIDKQCTELVKDSGKVKQLLLENKERI